MVLNAVNYVADENGYRVTKLEKKEIGDGPMVDKYGRAIVQTYVGGVETQYAIKAEPIDPEDNAAADGVDGAGLAQPTAGLARVGNVKLVEVEPGTVVIGQAEDDEE